MAAMPLCVLPAYMQVLLQRQCTSHGVDPAASSDQVDLRAYVGLTVAGRLLPYHSPLCRACAVELRMDTRAMPQTLTAWALESAQHT
jgi:hypothetical protein